MYSRQNWEKHTEALTAANSAISAAVCDKGYEERVLPFIDDFLEISEMFWDKCPITKKKLLQPGKDTQEIAGMFMTLVKGEQIGGFKSQAFTRVIERCERKIKGKLLGTRLMMMDKDKNPKAICSDNGSHDAGCHCKALTLFNLAQGLMNANG